MINEELLDESSDILGNHCFSDNLRTMIYEFLINVLSALKRRVFLLYLVVNNNLSIATSD